VLLAVGVGVAVRRQSAKSVDQGEAENGARSPPPGIKSVGIQSSPSTFSSGPSRKLGPAAALELTQPRSVLGGGHEPAGPSAKHLVGPPTSKHPQDQAELGNGHQARRHQANRLPPLLPPPPTAPRPALEPHKSFFDAVDLTGLSGATTFTAPTFGLPVELPSFASWGDPFLASDPNAAAMREKTPVHSKIAGRGIYF
jgi:hypothetical protein